MKTKLFALINILSFTVTIFILEFLPGNEGKLFLIGSILLFIISGFFSIFRSAIYNAAHKSYLMKSKAFMLDSFRLFSSFITVFIMAMSIIADFVPVDRNYVIFISYVTVYSALFTPCHTLIFKGHYLREAGV